MSSRISNLSSHLISSPTSSSLSLSQNKRKVNPYLVGNFEPTVNEGYYGELQVTQGKIPTYMKCQFLRIGPNPKFEVGDKPYHAFDGDGFVHSISFVDGKATYTKRFVRTRRLVASEQRGFDVSEIGAMAQGDFSYFDHVVDKFSFSHHPEMRMGKANTALVAHAGRVLALEEQDLPYEIVASFDGESNLRTVGQFDFNTKLNHAMTAHPKVDPVTGEMVFFGYEITSSKCHYSVVNKEGILIRDFSIPTPCGSMMHDMCIAGEYSLLFDMGYEFQIERLSNGKNPWVHRLDLPARFGLLPRLASSPNEVKWIDVIGCSLFHFANGWVEKDGTICVVGCRGDFADFMEGAEVINKPASAKDGFGRLYEWRLDPRQGRCISERKLSEIVCDFPQIDPSRAGLKTRFVYATKFLVDKAKLPRKEYAKSLFLIDAIVKFDLLTGRAVELPLVTKQGKQAYGGEAVFVANPNRISDGEEDNGNLLVYAHCEETNVTECQIINAATMQVDARMDMPERVPFGFHSLIVKESNVR